MKLLTNKRHEYIEAIEFINPYKMTLPFGKPVQQLLKYDMKIITGEYALKQEKWEIRDNKRIHAKIIIGENGAIIGSSNFSNNSINNLHECSVLIEDEQEIIKELDEYFETLWRQSSKRDGDKKDGATEQETR